MLFSAHTTTNLPPQHTVHTVAEGQLLMNVLKWLTITVEKTT